VEKSSGGSSTRPTASQRDRRLSTSSSSDGDSDGGGSSSGSSSSSSSDEDETDSKTPVNSKSATDSEKKTVVDQPKPLSAPPLCREAAKAAGPKIASALRAQQLVNSDAKDKQKKDKIDKLEKDKDVGGTKRKAEVLSDNGRVGVTISMTSLDRSRSPKSPRSPNPVGPLSPTSKAPRLAPITPPRASADASVTKEPHVTLSISLSPNGEAIARPGLDWRERSSQQQQQQQQQPQRSLSQDEQSAKVALLSLRGTNRSSPGSPANRSSSPSRPVPVLSPTLPGDSSAHPTLSRESGGSLSDQENVNLSNGHGPRSNNKQQQTNTDLLTPGLDYWYRKNPLVDQIFITDVTVNLMTVNRK